MNFVLLLPFSSILAVEVEKAKRTMRQVSTSLSPSPSPFSLALSECTLTAVRQRGNDQAERRQALVDAAAFDQTSAGAARLGVPLAARQVDEADAAHLRKRGKGGDEWGGMWKEKEQQGNHARVPIFLRLEATTEGAFLTFSPVVSVASK